MIVIQHSTFVGSDSDTSDFLFDAAELVFVFVEDEER